MQHLTGNDRTPISGERSDGIADLLGRDKRKGR